jgi:lipase ATG15
MIDDRAQNYQQIRCQAGLTDVIGCHNSIRSLCEISFSCGSRNRPVLCACVTEFGYPEPTPKAGTNRTFAEACGIEESNDA